MDHEATCERSVLNKLSVSLECPCVVEQTHFVERGVLANPEMDVPLEFGALLPGLEADVRVSRVELAILPRHMLCESPGLRTTSSTEYSNHFNQIFLGTNWVKDAVVRRPWDKLI